MVHEKRRGRRPEWRWQGRRHRGQSAGSEFRVPQRGRRTLREPTASAFRRNRPRASCRLTSTRMDSSISPCRAATAGRAASTSTTARPGFARTAPFGPPDAAARVGAAADFNADGSLDLVVGDEKAASMVVYLNDGKGRLTAGFRVADKARTPYAIAAGDLNNDRQSGHRARIHIRPALRLLQRWNRPAVHRGHVRRPEGRRVRLCARRHQRRHVPGHRAGKIRARRTCCILSGK